MVYARRKDSNSPEIEAALRAAGWHVHDTSGLHGFCDAVVARRGRIELVEMKTPKGKYKPAQEALIAAFLKAGVVVKTLRTVEDAVRL